MPYRSMCEVTCAADDSNKNEHGTRHTSSLSAQFAEGRWAAQRRFLQDHYEDVSLRHLRSLHKPSSPRTRCMHASALCTR
eukprot:4676489-Pleurochrysis_carterae.AAC.2